MPRGGEIKVGEWTVKPLRGLLQKGATTEHLQPKAMDVLICLAEHAPDVVERDSLLEKVWGSESTSDEPLTRCIGELRKAFGDKRGSPEYIETIPKRGYRLLARVSVPASASAVKPGAAKFSERSIAIMPFADLSLESDQQHLARGIADDILTTLTRISTLKVAARTSSFSLFGKDLDTIRTTLGVRFVLEGSVKKQGSNIRINVHVTDTNDGFQCFAASFDQREEDLLLIQEEIVQGIFDSLPGSTLQRQATDWRQAEIANVDAYDLYLRGRYAFNLRDMKSAVQHLQEACECGADFSSLYATFAAVLSLIPTYYLTDDRPATYARARHFAKQALAIEPGSALALSTLGLICLAHRQWREATRYLEEAIRKNPRETTARQWYGTLQLCLGRPDDAMKQYNIAREIDPISPPLLRDIALVHYFSHRAQEAEEQLDLARSLVTDPSQSYITNFTAMITLAIGRFDRALAAMKEDVFLSRLGEDELEGIVAAVEHYRTSGTPGEMPQHVDVKVPSPMMAARMFALSGNQEKALVCIRRGFHDADMWAPFSFSDPAFDEIRQTTAGKLLFARST